MLRCLKWLLLLRLETHAACNQLPVWNVTADISLCFHGVTAL